MNIDYSVETYMDMFLYLSRYSFLLFQSFSPAICLISIMYIFTGCEWREQHGPG